MLRRAALALLLLPATAAAQVVPPSAPAPNVEPKWAYYYAGKAYVASTNSLNVPAGGVATATVCNNAAAGGLTMHVFRRRIDNNGSPAASTFTYGGLAGLSDASIANTPAAFSTSGPSVAASLGSLVNTFPPSTIASVRYGVGTSAPTGTIIATGYLPPSMPYELQEPRGIGPGTCQAMFFKNGATATAYNVVLTVYWWEQ